MIERIKSWFRPQSPKPSRDNYAALEARVNKLEASDRKRRELKADAIKRARRRSKWLQRLEGEKLSEEEKRQWMAGD